MQQTHLRVTVIGTTIASAVYHVSTSPDGSVRHFLYPLEVEPADLSHEATQQVLRSVESLGLDSAVIDLVESPTGPVVIEVNEGLSVWRTIERTEHDLTPNGFTTLVTDHLLELLDTSTASSSDDAPNRTGSVAGSPVSPAARATS